jgi:hypothetical protein
MTPPSASTGFAGLTSERKLLTGAAGSLEVMENKLIHLDYAWFVLCSAVHELGFRCF